MKKIAFVGTHGSGKTRMSGVMCELFRKYGNSVYVIDEVVRKINVPINQNGTIRAQRMIWSEQVKEEMKASSSGGGIVLCDRSLLDSLVYYKYLLDHQGIEDEVFDKLKTMTNSWMSTYDEIIFFPVNYDLLRADDKRTDDPVFAQEIDKLMWDAFEPYYTVVCNDARYFNVPRFVKLFLQKNNLL